MIVVSDTTPLISLLKIDRISLLKDLFSQVAIPMAVYNELISNEDFSEEAEKIKSADFIKAVDVQNHKNVSLLQNVSGLDLGEAEAIALADELNAKLLLMDEAHGRKVAKQLNLQITGTIGILKTAYLSSLLSKDDICDAVEKLKNSRRFIGEDLLNSLLAL